MAGINVAIAGILVLVILYFVFKVIMKPIQLLWKLVLNSAVGLVLLMIFNYAASYFSFFIPINIITVLIAGFLGIPGVLLLLAFQLLIK
ncbi:MAG: pro-sigmaK processing inhibitor BofA family protein [Syntrophomonadaceae bacterium]